MAKNPLALRHNLPARKAGANAGATAAPFKKMAEIILADISLSMASPVAGYQDGKGQRRIDAVNSAISSYGDHIQTIAFSSHVELHVGPVELTPSASTDMDLALKEAIKWEPNYLLVLSDGAVDDPGETLKTAKTLAELAIIDTLYIGPEEPGPIEFMKKLAELGHGRFRRYDMTKPQTLQLETVIKGLLPPPAGSGQIEL